MTLVDHPVIAPPARSGPPVGRVLVGLTVAAAALGVALQYVVSWRAVVVVAAAVQAAGAGAFTVLALRRRSTEPHRGWTALAVFGGCWFLGRLLLVARGVPSASELGTGATIDAALWAVGIPVGLFGIHRQCFGDLPGPTRRRVLSDAVVSGLAMLLVGWVVYHHIDFDQGPPGADVLLVFPATMLLAAALLVTAAAAQPGRTRPLWMAAGCGTGLVVMAAVYHAADLGRPVQGPVVAAGLMATPLLLVGFAAVPDGPRPTGAAPVRGAVRLVIYVPAILSLVAGAWEIATHGGMYGVSGVLGVALAAAVMVNHRLVMGEAAAQLDRAERSERRFRVTFDQAPVGLVLADVDGTIVHANAAAADLVGLSVDDGIGRQVEDFFAPSGRFDRTLMRRRLRSGEVAGYAHESEIVRPDGTSRWVRVTVSALDSGSGLRGMGVIEDVTDRREAQEQLRHLAEHDELTDLLNRRGLERVLEDALAGSTDRRPAAVLLVDIDQFKLLNDSLGHGAGDRMLQACGTRLERALGGRGTVARFGGDEFCIVLDPATPEGQRTAALDIVAGVQGPVHLSEGDTYPTVSVGAVLARADASPAELLSEADEALYRAKARGRNRVEWHGRTEIARSHYDQRILSDLHRALAEGGLDVYHQPVVDVVTGSVVGAEALVRWHHPRLGTLVPPQFLPVAEKSGLMAAIGARVLHSACAAAAGWPAGPGDVPLTISVNVAPQQLLEPGFVLAVGEVLAGTGLDPDRLWLEITESALMQDVTTAERTLADLRGMGVHLALDDFGTGYSSLTYLKRFPVEAIKVDRTFVDGLGIDGGDTTIVSALVGLARQLGLTVVAEGVEGSEQWRILRDLRCTLAQGYLFGAPMPADEFVARLATTPVTD